ncbi:MAG: histidine kinase [Flavihumibacter sp.]
MKFSLVSKRWFRIALHVVAWLILFSLPYLMRPGSHEKVTGHELLGNILGNFIFIGFFYLNAYVLVPAFLSKRYYWRYVLAVIASYGGVLLLQGLLFIEFHRPGQKEFWQHGLFLFFLFLFFFAASVAFRLIVDQIRADQRAKEMETENLKTELSFLRSQASPHFMFNVLNNMVALARKNSELLNPR